MQSESRTEKRLLGERTIDEILSLKNEKKCWNSPGTICNSIFLFLYKPCLKTVELTENEKNHNPFFALVFRVRQVFRG